MKREHEATEEPVKKPSTPQERKQLEKEAAAAWEGAEDVEEDDEDIDDPYFNYR